VLGFSWAKALTKATPLGVASPVEGVVLPSTVFHGRKSRPFRTGDGGVPDVTPFLKASLLLAGAGQRIKVLEVSLVKNRSCLEWGVSWLGNDGAPHSSSSCADVCSRRRISFSVVLPVLGSRSCSSLVLNSTTMTQNVYCVWGCCCLVCLCAMCSFWVRFPLKLDQFLSS
jgi:hypothetical protein